MTSGAMNGYSHFGVQFGGNFPSLKCTYPTIPFLGKDYSGREKKLSAQRYTCPGTFRLSLLFHHKDGWRASASERYAAAKQWGRSLWADRRGTSGHTVEGKHVYCYHFCLLSYPPWPPSKPAGLSTVAIMFISFVWAANSSGRLHTKLLTPVTLRDEKQTFCSLNK